MIGILTAEDQNKLKQKEEISFICTCGENVETTVKVFRANGKRMLCKQCKTKETNLQKYGTKNYFETEEFKNKAKETNLQRYGSENIMQSNEGKNRLKNSLVEKYGVTHYSKTDKFKEVVSEKMKGNDFGKNKIFTSINRLNNISDYEFLDSDKFSGFYNNSRTEYNFKHLICGNVFSKFIAIIEDVECPFCFRRGLGEENEIKNFINSLGFYTEKNRTILNGKEIDIFVPSKNVGFEYNGFYWHDKDKNYHLDKTNLAKEKGIRLIHIFEDEWKQNQELTKSRIKNILGITDKKVFARKCTIKEISSNLSNSFIQDNHIQGFDNAPIRLGAFYQDELIGVMTFSRQRFEKENKENYYELSRFCVLKNHNVIGLASKLFSYFIKNYNPENIISYSDLRWNTGNVYEKIGMKYVSNTQIGYFYTKNHIRYNRFKFRKSQLKNMKSYSEDKTEREIMEEEGYKVIYDCGNMKFEWSKK